jgi:tetratricopeptide (TPR) repeat protein
MKHLIALLLLLTGAPAFASAASLFHDGRFAEAAVAGRAENTAPSLVLAGRATLIVASFQATDRDVAKAQVALAEHDFDAALALAPNNIEAQLQKATAIGYHGKLSKSPGLAKETRTRMEAVVARDPSYGLAWASLGGWHAGAVSTLGKFLAGTLLGANTKAAIADFETAVARDPKNPVHPAFYGLTLLDLGTDNAPRAMQMLQTVARIPARDAYESLLKKATAQVLPLLAAGDVKGAQALARQLLPFGKLG